LNRFCRRSGTEVSILERARIAYAKINAQRNGHAEAVHSAGQSGTGDKSDLSDKSEKPRENQGIWASGPCDQSPPYLLIRDHSQLPIVIRAIAETHLVGVDTETTGLDPRGDRVRLLSAAVDTVDGGTFTYLVDCFAVDPSPLFGALAEAQLVFHNAS